MRWTIAALKIPELPRFAVWFFRYFSEPRQHGSRPDQAAASFLTEAPKRGWVEIFLRAPRDRSVCRRAKASEPPDVVPACPVLENRSRRFPKADRARSRSAPVAAHEA